MARVQDALHPCPVVGEEQQSLAVEVQPPDRINARPAVRHQLRRRGPSPLVAERGDIAARLIEHQVDSPLRRRERHAVHADRIRFRVGALSDRRGLAVDAHAPRGDPFLRRPAGAQPRRGNQLLQTLCQRKAPLFLSLSGQTAAQTGSAFFRPPRPSPRIPAAPAQAPLRPWKRSARRPPAPP